MVIVALAGGVGGAKLSLGLYHELPADTLSLVVNTADDVEMLGLHISPDLDTALYTLTGLVNTHMGWGLDGDTFAALQMLGRYGHPTWFGLGDRDLATHLTRSDLLRQGYTLTDAMAHLARALELRAALLPMCDERVETFIQTPDALLPFQDYFVRLRAAVPVVEVRMQGIGGARPTPQVRAALAAAEMVVFCPSNPIVSIGPILAVPGLRDVLRALTVPRVAVSPIIGSDSVSGPAGRMMRDLGLESTALGVARLYADVVTDLIIDEADRDMAAQIVAETGVRVTVAPTVMLSLADRRSLARVALTVGRYGDAR